ncbi:MAG: sodium/solute symporter [Verrucomicrobiales bacterium]|nr:sodium/solute symporter [Verrucomicrobiales bacterium]
MTPIDWTILGVYAVSTLGLGWFFGRKQKSTKEYFVGSGKMNPFIIGVSLFATLLSTITYLAVPGEVLGKGPIYLSNYLAYPFVYLTIGYILLPVYMRQKVTSAYELLEERLGLSIRLLGATMFLMLRLVWMSLLVYLTAKAIAIMIGASDDMVPVIALVTGTFAIAYTSMGGLRAVVITDMLQTLLLYGGALLVIGTITFKMGGFGWFPSEWQHEVWDVQPVFSLDPSTRITIVGSIVSVFLFIVCTAAGDQVSIQRFMSTRDAKAARKAIAVQLTVGMIVGTTLGVVGLALLGYFQTNPGNLPLDLPLKEQADKLFPHYIAFHLPPIVTGLVVSGLFAAAMSSVDSGVNSITAVVLTDFLGRLRSKPNSKEAQIQFARKLAVGIGVVVVSLSSLIKYIPGNFFGITNRVVNLLTVPIALLFIFALFVPFANAKGVWIGVICSVVCAILVSFSGVIFGTNPQTGQDLISFQFITPVAFVVGLSVGLIACKIFTERKVS